MLLTNNSNYPVGLDISDLSLKLVQLGKNGNKIKIQAVSRLDLAPGVIANGEIKNKTELVKSIKKIISDPIYGKISSEEVVACLPESKTFIKLIEIQKTPNNLNDIICHEIEKHVPMSVEEIYYDWQIIEAVGDKYSVLIGAAPKNIVNQYTEILGEAKLYPVALEIEPVPICRCLLKQEIKGNFGIIDIGAKHTCMIFYSGNTILFTVSMPVSGEEITSKIMQALNMPKNQAEKAKIICGLDESKADGVIKKILADTIENLVEKIKEALDFYENYFGSRGKLDKILLCGGGSNIPDLGKIISEKISIKTTASDVLANLSEPKNKFDEALKQKTNSSFATAVGLALRGIFIDEL
ncbi:MAG: type IV pilus assembly protein PilM [bacterium]